MAEESCFHGGPLNIPLAVS